MPPLSPASYAPNINVMCYSVFHPNLHFLRELLEAICTCPFKYTVYLLPSTSAALGRYVPPVQYMHVAEGVGAKTNSACSFIGLLVLNLWCRLQRNGTCLPQLVETYGRYKRSYIQWNRPPRNKGHLCITAKNPDPK